MKSIMSYLVIYIYTIIINVCLKSDIKGMFGHLQCVSQLKTRSEQFTIRKSQLATHNPDITSCADLERGTGSPDSTIPPPEKSQKCRIF